MVVEMCRRHDENKQYVVDALNQLENVGTLFITS